MTYISVGMFIFIYVNIYMYLYTYRTRLSRSACHAKQLVFLSKYFEYFLRFFKFSKKKKCLKMITSWKFKIPFLQLLLLTLTARLQQRYPQPHCPVSTFLEICVSKDPDFGRQVHVILVPVTKQSLTICLRWNKANKNQNSILHTQPLVQCSQIFLAKFFQPQSYLILGEEWLHLYLLDK